MRASKANTHYLRLLFLAVTLLLSQLFVQMHASKHALHDDSDSVCEICLAANPAGAGLPVDDFQLDIPVQPDEVVFLPAISVRVAFISLPPARGPPFVNA
ncbi:MAG: hypothetical protein ACWA44_03055 [Thiotrichales bacterium]